jgi:hypothetical protein
VKDVRPPVEDAVLVMVTFPVDAEEFEFPAVSVNDPDATVTTPVPPEVRYGVYVTVYEVPLPENPESEPSVALTSDAAKFVDASLRLIATLTDDPELTDVAVTFAVGAVASRMTDASATPGAASMLPAASVARV